jgi:uncharacterized protein (DUF2141 family)
MIKLFFSLLLSITLISDTANLKITVKNIRPGKGDISVAVFDSAKNFFKKPVASQTVKADSETLNFSFGLPEGIYAVAVYQDINENRKLDKGWFNIPKEPYGLSNNFRPKFSAPTFDDCKFKLDRQTTLTITLK